VFDLLDQGLPGGPERKRILDDAEVDLVRLQPSICVTSLIENLKSGASGAAQVDRKTGDAKPGESRPAESKPNESKAADTPSKAKPESAKTKKKAK
jgi:hypothetical protein